MIDGKYRLGISKRVVDEKCMQELEMTVQRLQTRHDVPWIRLLFGGLPALISPYSLCIVSKMSADVRISFIQLGPP